jgi:hypothetical protein
LPLLRHGYYALEKRIFVDLKFEDRVKLDTSGGKFPIERLGLRDRAGKTIEDEAIRRVRLIDAAGDYRNHDIIGHEFATIHDVFDPQPRSRA